MIVVLVKSKNILLKDMTNIADKYFLAHLPIAKKGENAIKEVVSSIYKDNIQIKREKDLSAFHKVDLPLL